jgi:DNA-directed RNA polymerase beta subunit
MEAADSCVERTGNSSENEYSTPEEWEKLVSRWDDRFVQVCKTHPILDTENIDRYVNRTVTDRSALRAIIASVTETRRRMVATSIVESNGLVRHQIESFDRFMDYYLPKIIHENSTTFADSESTGRRHVLNFGNIVITKPSFKESTGINRYIYPWECRMRTLTYECSVLCDVKYTVFDISNVGKTELQTRGQNCAGLPLCETRISRETLICQIPCMLRSKYCHLRNSPYTNNECPLDPGGIFVINGNDKVIISQEKMRTNYPCVFAGKNLSKHKYVCEVRSCHETKMRSTSTVYIHVGSHQSTNNSSLTMDSEIVVNLPFIKKEKKFYPIPLIIIYRLLGVSSTDEMMRHILEHTTRRLPDQEMERLLRSILQNDLYNMPHQELCDWLGREGTNETTKEKRVKYVEHILSNEFFPHIGLDRSPETIQNKVFYFSYCVYKLCSVYLGRRNPDDKDHNANKRVETAGVLYAMLLRPLFRTMLKQASKTIKRDVDSGKVVNVAAVIGHKRITSSFKYAMNTGNWGPQKGGSKATGVAQIHNHMTVTSGLSNLRKLNTPFNKEGKMPKLRQLHISNWRIKDPAETPEGNACVSKDSEILLADGQSTAPICELNESVQVTTVDPNRRVEEATSIFDIFEEDPTKVGKKMYEIRTICDRTIRATEDHPFFTREGRLFANQLSMGSRVLIRPTEKRCPDPNLDTNRRYLFKIVSLHDLTDSWSIYLFPKGKNSFLHSSEILCQQLKQLEIRHTLSVMHDGSFQIVILLDSDREVRHFYDRIEYYCEIYLDRRDYYLSEYFAYKKHTREQGSTQVRIYFILLYFFKSNRFEKRKKKEKIDFFSLLLSLA